MKFLGRLNEELMKIYVCKNGNVAIKIRDCFFYNNSVYINNNIYLPKISYDSVTSINLDFKKITLIDMHLKKDKILECIEHIIKYEEW